MRAKWERLYKAEGGPPWCSGTPSTHLRNFLRSGSVVGGGASSVPPSSTASAPLPSPARGDAIDLGCGSNGATVALLASHGYRAAGVDFVGQAIRRARKLAAAEAAAPREAGEEEKERGTASVAFAACDVMTARLECWDDVRRMEEAELRRQLDGPLPSLPPDEEEEEDEGAASAASAAATAEAGRGRFALIFDCQTWHVLRLEVAGGDVGGLAVAARYRRLLKDGGVLLLMCGRRLPADGEGEGDVGSDTGRRADGPNEVSLAELRRVFCRESGWHEREIVATRFDPTRAYEQRPGGPPGAWAAVFEAVVACASPPARERSSILPRVKGQAALAKRRRPSIQISQSRQHDL